jgi:DNA-binding NtrC family response regulator
MRPTGAPWQDASVVDTRVHVNVEAPGQIDTVVVDVETGTGALLGRIPDTARAAIPAGDGVAIANHTVAVPSVSANHAAVWLTDDGLYVHDLGSRNGTWVRVPPHATVRLPRGDAQVRLAASPGGGDGDGLPEPAQFRAASDYGEGVARALRDWLGRHEMKVSVWVDSDALEATAEIGTMTFRLANNELVTVRSEGTIDERFHGLISRVARYVAAQNALYVAEGEARRDGMILASPEIRQVHGRIVQLATQGLSGVVLLGPSGTGKERLARTFHRYLRREGPLVAINCSALVRERAVADLFGAEAGSYTGAQKTMVGAVERADGGTLFLDEVGDLPLEIQPQLLRFLDLGEYQRLGAIGVPRTANVKIVAATNRDLRRMVNAGTFRADLFFRIALEVVAVPPLRQRFADVTAYLETQSLEGCTAYEALTPDALELLRRHTWDGNFRELVNLVHRLPRPATRGSLDAALVQRVLEAGALEPMRESIPPNEVLDSWTHCVQSCIAVFTAAGLPEPSTWSEVIEFIEQYLKPHALVHVAGLGDAPGMEAVAVGRIAERVKADRGTVIKQLRRYFDLPKRK